MKWLICLALIAFPPCALAADSAPPGVREAVNRLIAYEVGGEGSMRDEAFQAFFTPRFRGAIAAEAAQTDIQTIDTDFICQCQTAILKMRILDISGSKDAAVVHLESHAKGNPPIKVTLRLEYDGNSWLIADVQTPKVRSVLGQMEQGAGLAG